MLWTLWDKFLSHKKYVLGLNIFCDFFILTSAIYELTYIPKSFTWPLTEIFFVLLLGSQECLVRQNTQEITRPTQGWKHFNSCAQSKSIMKEKANLCISKIFTFLPGLFPAPSSASLSDSLEAPSGFRPVTNADFLTNSELCYKISDVIWMVVNKILRINAKNTLSVYLYV